MLLVLRIIFLLFLRVLRIFFRVPLWLRFWFWFWFSFAAFASFAVNGFWLRLCRAAQISGKKGFALSVASVRISGKTLASGQLLIAICQLLELALAKD
jgi:hypothetical protein